jgi:hypothetical protein
LNPARERIVEQFWSSGAEKDVKLGGFGGGLKFSNKGCTSCLPFIPIHADSIKTRSFDCVVFCKLIKDQLLSEGTTYFYGGKEPSVELANKSGGQERSAAAWLSRAIESSADELKMKFVVPLVLTVDYMGFRVIVSETRISPLSPPVSLAGLFLYHWHRYQQIPAEWQTWWLQAALQIQQNHHFCPRHYHAQAPHRRAAY